MSSPHILILAAGKGTRMKSQTPKVLHPVAGRPMIDYVLDVASGVDPATCTVVVGHGAETVKQALGGHRRPPLPRPGAAAWNGARAAAGGTAVPRRGRHAAPALGRRAAAPARDAARAGGRAPRAHGAAATVVTAVVDDPAGYGRIVREDGAIARIVEDRDATPEERAIGEINAGIYAFDLEPLFPALSRIGSANAQGEYYLPDLVSLYRAEGRKVAWLTVPEVHEILGINSRVELAATSRRVWRARAEALMAAGVTIEDPDTTYIDAGVSVGPDTVIRPGVVLEGQHDDRRGLRDPPRRAHRGLDARRQRHDLRSHASCRARVLQRGRLVGPFAQAAPGNRGWRAGARRQLRRVEEDAARAPGRRRTTSRTSATRRSARASTSAPARSRATTTACARTRRSSRTASFVGSDTQLIAPVRVGAGAYVAAGSSITEDVPAGALAIARGRQVDKDGWATKRAGQSAKSTESTKSEVRVEVAEPAKS